MLTRGPHGAVGRWLSFVCVLSGFAGKVYTLVADANVLGNKLLNVQPCTVYPFLYQYRIFLNWHTGTVSTVLPLKRRHGTLHFG